MEQDESGGRGHGSGPYGGTGGLGGDYLGGFAAAGGQGTSSGQGDAGAPATCAWERRQDYGLLNALYLTTRDVLTGPQKFFRAYPPQVGFVPPLLYAVILGVLASFMAWLWSLAGSSLQTLAGTLVGPLFRGPTWNIVSLLLSPLTAAVILFVYAGLMHATLMLMGGNRRGFGATFRVAAYGKAAAVVGLLPFCGGMLAIVVELAIDVMGLYSIHRTEPWRAAVAVVAPAVISAASVGAAIMLALLGSH